MAGNFESSPGFGPLPDKYIKKVVDILPIDLPIELAGTVREYTNLCIGTVTCAWLDSSCLSNIHVMTTSIACRALLTRITGGEDVLPDGRT